MSRFPRMILAGMVALTTLAPAVAAQVPARGQGDRDRLERRVRARMTRMFQERLQLTDEQGRRLGEAMEELQEERRVLGTQERILRQQVDGWLERPDGTEEEAGELLDRMVELREAESDLFREEQERLSGILSPQQLLTFHALRGRMSERIRALRGPGGPPGGAGPGGRDLRER